MHHFPILLLLLFFFFFLGGGGVEIIHHDCNLEKNRMEQQTSHPPENNHKARESQSLPFSWGRWGGAGVNDKFLSILSKNSSSKG